jgi:hypothetical protein
MGRETSVLSICLMEDSRASDVQPWPTRALLGGRMVDPLSGRTRESLNFSGFSRKQMQDWRRERDLNAGSASSGFGKRFRPR